MTQLENIHWNISKHIIENIFIKNYKGALSNDNEKTLEEIKSILGENVFEKLCCKIMQENS
jgi:hypothetical protein